MESLIIAADLRLAHSWDRIASILPKKHQFLNPNLNFQKLVSRIKPKQTLVVNGDIVDHCFSDYGNTQKTNWSIAKNILKNSPFKFYFNLGNHEYRQFPINLAVYGLRHNHISEKIRKKYKYQFYSHQFGWLRELKNFWMGQIILPHFAKTHLRTDQVLELEQAQLILLNTGPDATFTNQSSYNPYKRLKWLHGSVSMGLTTSQLDFLEKTLSQPSQKETYVFTHFPYFMPSSLTNLPFGLQKIDLLAKLFSPANTLPHRRRLLEILKKSHRNLFLVSSHFHIPFQMLFHKHQSRLEEGNWHQVNRHREDKDLIKIISTLPMGAIEPTNLKVGYLEVNPQSITEHVIHNYRRYI